MLLMQPGGAAIKSSRSHPRSFEPKSNQATDSARIDFLHRLVFLLPVGTEKPLLRWNRLTQLRLAKVRDYPLRYRLNRTFTTQGFSCVRELRPTLEFARPVKKLH